MQPRPASTLALLRDTEQGLEVLMLQRTLKAVFMPGFYVFPGGAVDDGDRDLARAGHLQGHDDDSASALLGLPEGGGLGYLVAAVRECFEESGMLLARDSAGQWLDGGHPVMDGRWAVGSGEADLGDLCRSHGLALSLDGIAYLDHWVTPPGPPRRFDTRFFAAVAPPDQVPAHDGDETIDHIWIRPQDALEDRRQGRREFATPTVSVLRKLSEFASADEVLAYARDRRPQAFPTQPWPARKGDEVVYIEPGRPAYDEVCKLDPDAKGNAQARLEAGLWVALSNHVSRLTLNTGSDDGGPGFNSYLVRAGEQALVVDPVIEGRDDLHALLEACDGVLSTIVLTRPREQEAAARTLQGATGARILGVAGPADLRLAHGEPHRLGGLTLKLLHTPGQADDRQCLLIQEEGMLFSGTAVLERSIAKGYLPAADVDAYVAGLARLLEEDLHWIAPGRGFLMGQPQKVLDHLMTQCLSKVQR
tara:strand:- start:2895 stop:4325 length:1431 start_codon:yes stop_codon:yes gene_type:complete